MLYIHIYIYIYKRVCFSTWHWKITYYIDRWSYFMFLYVAQLKVIFPSPITRGYPFCCAISRGRAKGSWRCNLAISMGKLTTEMNQTLMWPHIHRWLTRENLMKMDDSWGYHHKNGNLHLNRLKTVIHWMISQTVRVHCHLWVRQGHR